MKKVSVLLMCALGLLLFTNCKSKTKTAGESAKAIHEKLQNQDYAGYVETIYWEELDPVVVTDVKAKHTEILKQKVQPAAEAKGGIKEVAVKSETVAPDVQTANVTLTNTYNNGDMEDVIYALVFDEPTQEWKVNIGPDKEIWATVLPDGTTETVKLKGDDNREIIKFNDGEERDFVKEIEDGNRDVEKIKADGEKEVHKVIEKKDETVVKDKINGEKEVTKIPKE